MTAVAPTATRRVVWADDATLIRTLLVDTLSGAGVDVVGVAGDYAGTMEVVRSTNPDAAILDVRMAPDFLDEGIRAAIDLRQAGFTGGLLVVSTEVDSATAGRLITQCGPGIGYLLKDNLAGAQQLVTAIERICSGESVLDPTVVRRLVERRRQSPLLTTLTPTELTVLRRVAEGLSNHGIAEALIMSERTVESHISHVFNKLGLDRSPDVHRRVMATIAFLRELG